MLENAASEGVRWAEVTVSLVRRHVGSLWCTNRQRCKLDRLKRSLIVKGAVPELLSHLLVKPRVLLKRDPLLHNHLLELFFRNLLTLDLNRGKLHIDQVLLLVLLVHFVVQVG